MEDGRTR